MYLSAVSLISAVLTVLLRVIAPRLPRSAQLFMVNKVGALCCSAKISVEPDNSCLQDLQLFDCGDNSPFLQALLDQQSKHNDSTVLLLLANQKQLGQMTSCLNELLRIKKEKVASARQAAINESVWQKIEFLFNGTILLIYISVMCYYLVSYSYNAGQYLLA